MEMGAAVADKHTDGNRNHDGSYELHGVNEKGVMEMAYSVADKHTDGNRNYDGSYELHGIKKVGTWSLTNGG